MALHTTEVFLAWARSGMGYRQNVPECGPPLNSMYMPYLQVVSPQRGLSDLKPNGSFQE